MPNFDVISRTDQWQIVIKGMGANRGPGSTIVTLNDAKSAGASLYHNAGGEMHFTLPVEHPSIRAIPAKLCHYSLQIRTTSGFVEKFAGLVWDMQATDSDVIFMGIDYLALFGLVTDTRYDVNNIDLAPEDGGSKYYDRAISDIVTEQLNYAVGKTNSPVGFISVGTIATMDEHATIWSTWSQTLPFITGLIDSHRQGTGIKTRISVKNIAGTYTVIVENDPGVDVDLSLTYKKPGNNPVIQGYQVVEFGSGWATSVDAVGRTQVGLELMYQSEQSPDMDPTTWGLFTQPMIFENLSDNFDMERRTKQAALKAGQQGKQVGLGLRSRYLKPEDGYAICDSTPVDIDHGAVDTASWGSGVWTIWGLTWEGYDNASCFTNLVLLPQDGISAPDGSISGSDPLPGGGSGGAPGTGGRDHKAVLTNSGSPLVLREFTRVDINKSTYPLLGSGFGASNSGTWIEGPFALGSVDWGCELVDNTSWPNTACGVGLGAYQNEGDFWCAYGFTMPVDTGQIATQITATITPNPGPGGCTPYQAHITGGSFCGSVQMQTAVRMGIVAGTDSAIGLDIGGQFTLGPGNTVINAPRSMLSPGSSGVVMFGPDFHVTTTYACANDILYAGINDGTGKATIVVQMKTLLPGTYGWIDASPEEAPDGARTSFTLIGGYTLVDRVTLNGLIMPDDSWSATDGSTIQLIGWTPILGDSFQVHYYIP